MNSETVNLIATDPPLNKIRDFQASRDGLVAGALYVSKAHRKKSAHGADGSYEPGKNVRRENGKLVHDGGNTATLSLAVGATYTLEQTSNSTTWTSVWATSTSMA